MGTPKHRRRFLWPVVGVVAVGAVATWYFVGGASDEAVAPEYDSVKVARGALSASVTASGTLSPLVTVEVGSQVSGRIQQLFADYNSLVKKGEVIAKIDPRLFETEVAKMKANQLVARAAVQRAEAELKDASVRRDRAVTLAKQGIVTLADRDAAEATFATAAAQLESSKATLVQVRASLEQAQANLTYTTIVSPIDGVVISRSVDVGQTVTAAMTTPTLFTIAEDLRKMEVHTSVAESDVGRLAPGLDVEFTVDAYPTDRFQGTVKEVRYSPQTVQNVVTYDAVVSVENPEAKLRPGMTADVTFLVEERPNVLMIPNAALRF
ncbi:MAG: efflux RND transporter periplasmic adaptor subunit, partial [Myxococcales bacterium]|nr:efflux RND transporter periplasmic adaptor subunit [Myxococcales bacterium]